MVVVVVVLVEASCSFTTRPAFYYTYDHPGNANCSSPLIRTKLVRETPQDAYSLNEMTVVL